ncbi:MAG: phospholipase [Myxococcota bacterium]|nr:phospholipase [Myxococcota bacterium]
MSDAGEISIEQFQDRLGELGGRTLHGLHALEAAFRRLEPATIPTLRQHLRPVRDALERAGHAFTADPVPEAVRPLAADLGEGASRVLQALEGVTHEAPEREAAPYILRAMSDHACAQEALYSLRTVLPPLGRYFVEPAFHDALDTLDREPPEGMSVGLHRAGAGTDRRKRGGFCLYVPESTDGSRALPLVVALHGGMGHGADFLWTWLREARGRGFLLLAPTSEASTWSLVNPAIDGAELRRMVAFVKDRWNVDEERVLLTGLSDGATFSFLTGLEADSPFTALAPASGVFHPANHAAGNLERAEGRRIFLVHGARDWMFPVQVAHMARDALQAAGADLVYREIEDLSHGYAREVNDEILRWFDPSLALPSPDAPSPSASGTP